jgi:hypothetical protein
VVWEKMEMVPPSIFPSKIYGNPRQRHVAPFKMRHVVTLSCIFFLNYKALKNKIKL